MGAQEVAAPIPLLAMWRNAFGHALGASYRAWAPQVAQGRMWLRAFADRRGVVKFFNPDRGFGFITSEDEDIFVHYTSIGSTGGFRSLDDGEEVEFDLELDATGKQR